MIVEEPPYDLIVLFADEDARRLVMQLIERGQETNRGCLRPFRWRAIRDPRRDTAVRAAAAALRPFLGAPDRRFIVLWDHSGCGRDSEPPTEVERDVKLALVQAGVPETHVEAIAIVPELEAVLAPAWRRVVEVLSARRGTAPPSDSQLLAGLGAGPLSEHLESRPKEVFDALLRLLNLRHSAELFDELARQISIPVFKGGHVIERASDSLRRWFPPAV